MIAIGHQKNYPFTAPRFYLFAGDGEFWGYFVMFSPK